MLGLWIKRSLRYYGERHLLFAGTAALVSAVLCAALLTGDSLQRGLQRGLRERLGKVRSAVFLPEGVFPASLARRLPDAQAGLLLRGELLNEAGAVCAGRAQIIGVAGTNAFLNARGREMLAGEGAQGSVRFEKPQAYPVEMPLGEAKRGRMARRAVRFGKTADAGGLLRGDFAFQAFSVQPVNVFLPLETLSAAADVPGMANLLVSMQSPSDLERNLAQALTPEDMGLVLEGGERTTAGSEMLNSTCRASRVVSPETVVKSRRVFLPAGVREAVERAGFADKAATFYLADAFEQGTNATPYGFVAAVTPDGVTVPQDLKDDEVVVNAWLAQTLDVKPGDRITLRWRRFEAGGRLAPDHRVFRVREILPMERASETKRLMPVFPGLKEVDSCADWDVGLPMDEAKLKDPGNEAYWKQWRETPKAFLSFSAGQACFGTAFGGEMCLRVAADETAVRTALRTMPPARAGFSVRPVWREGVAAAKGSTDFRLLFTGMAFVLMASALLLSALTLALALETRKGEVALFGALGWGPGKILRVLAAEWCVPLAAGAVAGGGLGAVLAQGLVWSLDRFWRGAFAGAAVAFHFSWVAAGAAAGCGLALTALTLLWTVRRLASARPVELWQTEGRESADVLTSGHAAGRKTGHAQSGTVRTSIAGGALASAALAVMLRVSDGAADGVFFGAGFLLMLSIMLFEKNTAAMWVNRKAGHLQAAASPFAAGVRRAVLAPRRSVPVVVLLAVGTFLAVGILSMKHDPAADWQKTWSGSGGFASLVTSVMPQERARGLALARHASGSAGGESGKTASGAAGIVPVRVHEGDEAGCLNMQRPVVPRLLGLDARTMARVRAFEPKDSGGIWTLLEGDSQDGTLPALAADQAMLTYSLKAKAGPKDGDVLTYTGADGKAWRVRIVGALPVRSGILQGALIMDERSFVKMFPNEGYRLWLCDYAPYLLREAAERRGKPPKGGEGLRRAVEQLRHPEPGVTVETTEERLRLLGSVEDTYLDMFLVLAGLGVVLGVAGIALVILRGMAERRGELALLRAVGVPQKAVVTLLGAEYGAMVIAGLTAGIVSSLVSIQPAARALHGHLPWGTMAGVVAGIVLCAGVCVAGAAAASARRYGPEILKEEV